MKLITTTNGTMDLETDAVDGSTIINLYSAASTELGRQLTNFAPTGFAHPKYGNFMSMEGYWHYCATGHKHDELRLLSGYKAKQFAKSLEKVFNRAFQEEIIEGIHCKLKYNPMVLQLLMESNVLIPFAHYYTFGDRKSSISDMGVADAFERNAFWILECDAIRRGKELMY